MTIGLLRNIN